MLIFVAARSEHSDHRQTSSSSKVRRRARLFEYQIFKRRLIGYPGIPPGAPDRPQAAVKGVSASAVVGIGVQ